MVIETLSFLFVSAHPFNFWITACSFYISYSLNKEAVQQHAFDFTVVYFGGGGAAKLKSEASIFLGPMHVLVTLSYSLLHDNTKQYPPNRPNTCL